MGVKRSVGVKRSSCHSVIQNQTNLHTRCANGAPHRPPSLGLCRVFYGRGLQNPKNLCPVNSALQLLRHDGSLRNGLIKLPADVPTPIARLLRKLFQVSVLCQPTNSRLHGPVESKITYVALFPSLCLHTFRVHFRTVHHQEPLVEMEHDVRKRALARG